MNKTIIIVPAGNLNFGDNCILFSWLNYYENFLDTEDRMIILANETSYISSFTSKFKYKIEISNYLHRYVWNNVERISKSNGKEIIEYSYEKYNREAIYLLSIFNNCDFVHFVGGGIINNLWKDNHYFYNLITQNIGDTPYIITGQTIGPLNDENKACLKDFFRGAKLLDVRDNCSCDYLRMLNENYVKTTDDTLIECTCGKSCDDVINQFNDKHINICFQEWKGLDNDKYIKCVNIICDFCNDLLNQNKELYIYLLELSPLDKDSFYSNYISKKLSGHVKIISLTNLDLNVGKQIIQTAEMNISSRYHIAVFSLLANVKTISIVLDDYYKEKMKGIHQLFNSSNYIEYEKLDVEKLNNFCECNLNKQIDINFLVNMKLHRFDDVIYEALGLSKKNDSRNYWEVIGGLELQQEKEKSEKYSFLYDAVINSRSWKIIRIFGNVKDIIFKKQCQEVIPEEEYLNNLLSGSYKNNLLKETKNIKPVIAYLIPGCNISGGIAIICQHVNRLMDRGYDVRIITEDQKNSITWFPNQRAKIYKKDEIDFEIDYLVATGYTTAITALSVPAVKKFYFVQSDESRFFSPDDARSKLAIETYKMDFVYITEAIWIKELLKKKYGKDSYYVPNALDRTIFYKTQSSKRTKPRILIEGSIDLPYKGMNYAYEALKGLDCEIWCVSSYGVPNQDWKIDKFFSKVPINDMKFIYSNCDILLKMSEVEGVFGPPMEMMACGGTCVVSDVTGCNEYIKNEYNAIVVPKRDVNAARKAIIRLLNDDKLVKQLKINGQRTVKQFDWDYSIDLLEEALFNK